MLVTGFIFGCVLDIISFSKPSLFLFLYRLHKKEVEDMTSDSGVKIALRNKITCLEAKLKRKTVQVVDK